MANDPTSPYSTGPKTSDQESKKSSGCFFYGCVSILVGIVIVAVGGYIGFRVIVNKMVDKFTEPTAMVMPASTLPPEKATEVKTRLQDFIAGLEKPAPNHATTLQLSADELNAVIATDPMFEDFRNRAHLTFTNDQIGGEISYPLDDIGFPGRYVNGSGGFRVSLENGILLITLESLSVKGEAIPEEAMDQIRKENLAKEFYKNAHNAELLQKLESIKVENGMLTVKARAVK